MAIWPITVVVAVFLLRDFSVHRLGGNSGALCDEYSAVQERRIHAYGLFRGNLYEGVDDAIEFVEWVPHPRYSGSGTLQYDIAMIRLKTPKTDVAPMPVNETAPAWYWQGTELTYVGFGITDDGRNDSGIKRTANIDYHDTDAQFIYGLERESNLCSGDLVVPRCAMWTDLGIGRREFVCVPILRKLQLRGGGSGADPY